MFDLAPKTMTDAEMKEALESIVYDEYGYPMLLSDEDTDDYYGELSASDPERILWEMQREAIDVGPPPPPAGGTGGRRQKYCRTPVAMYTHYGYCPARY